MLEIALSIIVALLPGLKPLLGRLESNVGDALA